MTVSMEQLEAFVTTADTGSLSAASRALRKSQSTISSLVSNMEIDCGLSLFARSVQGLQLTAAGYVVYKDAVTVLRAATDLSGRIQSLVDGVEEHTTLAIDPGALSESQLNSVLESFAHEYPSVELILLNATVNEVSRLVVDGIADMGVMLLLELDYRENFNSKPLASIPYDIVASPDHPLANLEQATAQDHYRYRYLTVTNHVELIREGLALPVSKQWYISDLRTLISMLQAGLGWSAVPHHLVEESLGNGSLVCLPADHVGTMHREAYLVWSKSRELGKAGQFLLDSISKIFK
jgi:DNA-binding transcriptional LysR family regulator